MTSVAIIGAKRTPMGAFLGELSTLSVTELGGAAIAGAVSDAKLDPASVDGTLMGIVLSAGAGQAPARQASVAGGLPFSVPATAISKVCGSGMKAVIDGARDISAGSANLVVAGGMESMSNAPHLLLSSRKGQRLGDSKLIDHMFFDGLEDAYQPGTSMGRFAEDCAGHYQFTREQQDQYALQSLSLSLDAARRGAFDREIAEIRLKGRQGEHLVRSDEQPRTAKPEKIPTLKPAFASDGTITAASASSISDGAAALVLASAHAVDAGGLVARAWIRGTAAHAQEPGWFTTAPVFAARKLLAKLGWATNDVDLWEVNEAFAVVALAFMTEMGVPRERLNVNGGACALGHPIGASGARIIVTLLHALEKRSLTRGLAAICIGGGEALAIAIERAPS